MALVFHVCLGENVGDGLWVEPNQSAAREGSLPVGGEDASIGGQLWSLLDLMDVLEVVRVAKDVVAGLIVQQKWVAQGLMKVDK